MFFFYKPSILGYRTPIDGKPHTVSWWASLNIHCFLHYTIIIDGLRFQSSWPSIFPSYFHFHHFPIIFPTSSWGSIFPPLFLEVTFSVDKSLEPFAEAVWREWWRRSGIPRQDFKDRGAWRRGKPWALRMERCGKPRKTNKKAMISLERIVWNNLFAGFSHLGWFTGESGEYLSYNSHAWQVWILNRHGQLTMKNGTLISLMRLDLCICASHTCPTLFCTHSLFLFLFAVMTWQWCSHAWKKERKVPWAQFFLRFVFWWRLVL